MIPHFMLKYIIFCLCQILSIMILFTSLLIRDSKYGIGRALEPTWNEWKQANTCFKINARKYFSFFKASLLAFFSGVLRRI